MRCQYIQKNPVLRCWAFLKGLKLPTRVELDTYCLNGVKYLGCPTYIKKEKDLQKIA